MGNEWAHIAMLRQMLAPSQFPEWLRCGIGDDTAIMAGPQSPSEQLVTADMLLEGVHFDLRHATPQQVGEKAMNVNISDIAAMAGRPTAAVVAVALPRQGEGTSAALAEDLARGLKAAADQFGVVIVGGDTNSSPGPLVISVTLFGETTKRGAVRRSGARPGDAICVTSEPSELGGGLGYSLAGRHLAFLPRVSEALYLNEHFDLHAMIDLSDGLGSDIFHIARESRCGAILDAAAIPIARRADPNHVYRDDTRSPLDHGLHDGEDFELLFTLPTEQAEQLVRTQPLRSEGFDVQIHRIGTITGDEGVRLLRDGVSEELVQKGYAHQW